MTTVNATSRRSFVLRAGACLSGGVAATGLVSARAVDAFPAASQLVGLQLQLDQLADLETLRHRQLTLQVSIESRAYAALGELFTENAYLDLRGVRATGRVAIQGLLERHSGYRPSVLRQADRLAVSDDRLAASASWHTEVEVCTPLLADCTAARMAQLQGQMASKRWEAGRFTGHYVKTDAQWQVTSLRYFPV